MKSKKIFKTKTVSIVGALLLLVAGLLGAIYLSQRSQNLAKKASGGYGYDGVDSCETAFGSGWHCCIDIVNCQPYLTMISVQACTTGYGNSRGSGCYNPLVPTGGDVCKSFGQDWQCCLSTMPCAEFEIKTPVGGSCQIGYMGSNLCYNSKKPLPKTPRGSGLMFVTSQVYSANLGGLAGADAKCQSLAKQVGLSGTFKAWLSDSSTIAKMRFRNLWGQQYVRRDGKVISETFAGLFDGNLDNPINIDEKGQPVGGMTWTATNQYGVNKGEYCNNWTSATGTKRTIYFGDISKTDPRWTEAGQITCSSKARLYCYQD